MLYIAQPKHYDCPAESVSRATKAAHERLYKGYVRAFNDASARADAALRGENQDTFREAKRAEAAYANAVYLHELYFANSFDPHSEIMVESLAYMRLQRDWGTFDDWQREMMACGTSSKNGWIVTAYSTFFKRYSNFILDGHDVGSIVGHYPVVVLDMHEHAYAADYADDKLAFIVSQMREIRWDVVEARVRRAEEISNALRTT